MKSRILSCLVLAAASFGMTACVDPEIDPESGHTGRGESSVSLGVTFHALSNGSLGATRSERGDLIGAIDDVFVAWYTEDGALAGSAYLPHDRMDVTDVDRPGSATELRTQHAEFQCRIPYGRYRIYAVANMGDLSSDDALAARIGREEDLRSIVQEWVDDPVGDNCQMAGYFTPNDSGGTRGEAPLLTVDAPRQRLHAWIRRLVSKVTVSFDTADLYENVYIYIKSARIHNIPRSCTLLDPNDGKRIADPAKDVIFAGDTIAYGSGDDFNAWPRLTRAGNPLGGGDTKAQLHRNDARALFFFENMQGEGKLKWQDTTGMNSSVTFPDGNKPDDEGYRDGKPCGTYIEVEGYYISNTVANPGKGRIVYRFMLGKDTERDYNAERNFHYKLTLRFRGHANDVDWHIEYDEDKGIYAPNPYFISYLYDHEMMLPLKIKGKPVGKLKAEIVENNWGPHEAGSEFEYYRGEVYTMSGKPDAGVYADSRPEEPQVKDGPWNGFLSLVKTHINWIGRDKPYWSGYNYFYWKQRPQDFGTGLNGMDLTSYGSSLLNGMGEGGFSPRGCREYDLSQSATVPDAADGDYIVTRNDADEQTVVQIPFYTRALQLTDKTGFSGNNPYFAYRRSAKVRLEVQLEGHALPTVDTITIYQVRRVVNPKGIYRRHDNDAAFHVALTHRLNEAATRYTVYESEGPWKAEVEVGKEWIKLNGVLGGTVEGSTGSEIRFTYQPAGTIGEDQSRCGIILVRYHNLSCYHRIFVRQGYAPIRVAGSAKWHTFNLKYQDHEAAAPCEEGSLFRYGNVDQPIDAVNNQFDRFADHATTPFRLAPTSSGLTGTWNAVPGQTRITSKSRSSEGFSNMPQTIGGRQCHVAELADFEALQKNCQFAFGVLYDDASTETSLNLSDVNGYAYYNASNTNKGMRGCFVFNPAGSLNSGGAGANIFFPVGVSGYGRRKHCAQENGKYGVLRYAARSALYTSSDVRYRPLFHTIYTNFGGLYWCNRQSNGTSSWDINVSTYDFNHFGSNAFLISDWTAGDGPNVSDACFVRLVE